MKLFRLVLIAALIAAGFTFSSSHDSASACASEGGSFAGPAYYSAPFSASAGTTITLTAISDAAPGNRTWIALYIAGMGVVISSYAPEGVTSHTETYTFAADAPHVEFGIAWEHWGHPANAYFVSTSDCGGGRDMMPLPSQAVVGTFVTNTELLSAPDTNAGTGIVMDIGKTLWVLGVDSSGTYYQVMMSGSLMWVPVSSMGPNFDEVWNGTPLPTTVVN